MSDKNDDFTVELKAKYEQLNQEVNTKRNEFNQLNASQRKLEALINSEKHSQAKPKDKKGKHGGPSKDMRSDILKHEAKYKEQGGKIAKLQKQLHYLEEDLKETAHGLRVVGAIE
ncbi:MAG: hypothetical protein JKY15_04400 [Deltaproteobacteria bacterium]|nr:hypothetical protein [Deltaproteobacteria bacterium]